MATWRLAQGCGDSWTVPIVDDDGAALSYVGTEILTGSVWPGGERAALFAITPTWLNPAAGTTTVVIGGASTAALSPATYSVQLKVDGKEYYTGRLAITGSPGVAAAPVSYIADDDLRDFAAWIDELQADSDQTGFANQCAKARSWLDAILMSRWQYAMAPGPLDPGYGAWSLGYDASMPSKWLRDQLAANKLMVRDLTREIVAKRALSLICRAQLGRNGDHSYQSLARGFAFEAEELVKTYRAEIDTNGDGIADIVINCGTSSLR